MRKIAFLQVRDGECPEELLKMCSELTPLVERLEEDGQVYLDISGCGSAGKILMALAHKFWLETGSRIEIGMAGSKLLAYLALRRWELVVQGEAAGSYRRLDGPGFRMIWVLPGHEQEFLANIALRDFPPIDSRDAGKLRRIGLSTVGELAALSAMQIQSLIGRDGQVLVEKAKGIDLSPVLGLYPPGNIVYPVYFGEGCSDLIGIGQQVKDACRVLESLLSHRESGFKCLRLEIQTETGRLDLERKLSSLAYRLESLFNISMRLLEQADIKEAVQKCIIKLEGISPLNWAEQDLFIQASACKKEQKKQALYFALNNLEDKFPGMLLRGREINRREQILSLWDPWRQI